MEQYPIYDLSNPHFRHVTIVDKDNQSLTGSFVRFTVLKGDIEYLYPAEKYCFVPSASLDKFARQYNAGKGTFSEMPPYVKQLGLHEMREIVIKPELV